MRTDLQGCLFDLYDTLVFLDRDAHTLRSTRMAELCGVSLEAFLKGWKKFVVPSNLGQLRTTEERARAVLCELGQAPTDSLVGEIASVEHAYLRSSSSFYPDATETLDLLRSRGLKLGLVTNASASVRQLLAARHLDHAFDTLVISSEVGCRKPDASIYERALLSLGLEAEAAAFVGDGNDRELDGAKAVGLLTVAVCHGSFRPVMGHQSDPSCIDFSIDSLSALPDVLRV